MKPTVELIFDATCPHVDAAREQIREALVRAGQSTEWTEWERSAPNSPAYVRRYASPSVLVAGRDVVGGAPLDAGSGCRLYRDTNGAPIAAPTAQMILAALSMPGASR